MLKQFRNPHQFKQYLKNRPVLASFTTRQYSEIFINNIIADRSSAKFRLTVGHESLLHVEQNIMLVLAFVLRAQQ